MEHGTVTMHLAYATSDDLADWDIKVFVAIDHDTGTVIDADLNPAILERRLWDHGWLIDFNNIKQEGK
jgi:hypothetical protein